MVGVHVSMTTDDVFVLPAIPDTAASDQVRYDHIFRYATHVLAPMLHSAKLR